MLPVGSSLALFATCLRPLWAEFMVLDPTDYMDHYTEGWPGRKKMTLGSGRCEQIDLLRGLF